MSFLLYKLMAQLVLPLPGALLLLGLALVCLGAGWRRLAAVGIAVAAGWLWLWSAPLTTSPLIAALERRHPPTPVSALPDADVIVVLGGGVAPVRAPRLTPDLGPSADRVLHAARLYRAGRAPLVVATGGRMPWDPGGSESDALAALLVEWGVPPEAVLRESDSRTTRENAVGTRSLLQERGATRVILVTSALHMDRALRTFCGAGMRATPAPTDFEITDTDFSLIRLAPNASALDRGSRAIWELVGTAMYDLRGWLADPPDCGAPR